MPKINIYPDAKSLARGAAEHFTVLAGEAVTARGVFNVALAGGSTPRDAYALLASDLSGSVDWPRVNIFWGDERSGNAPPFIPPDHPDSNYRMAHETLLSKIPLPAGNVHRIRSELPPQEAAARYRKRLKSLLPGESFDLILLGLGADGHTASLFPSTTALAEREHAVVAVYVEKLDTWRVTLTLPILNAARNVQFLVSGEAKANVVQTVLEDPQAHLPAQRIRPTPGQLTWNLDAPAAKFVAQAGSFQADE